MRAPRRDYKVAFLREETIAERALDWRKAAGHHNQAYFNVVEFVTDVLSERLKRSFKISFFDMRPGDDPAYVSFDSSTGLPTLNIDKETWDDANLGDPYARYVVAHEIGHLIFHDHDAKAFSNDPREQIVFELMNEFSAEWQANIFAGYFLLPTHIVASFDDVQRLTESCGVTRQLAEDRLRTVRTARARLRCDGDACSNCGNFTFVRDGSGFTCSTCSPRLRH